MNHYSFIAASDADLMTLNDARARSDIQVTLTLSSLVELSTLISLLQSGLSLALNINIEGVKEVWSVSEELQEVEQADFDGFYTRWLAKTQRIDSDAERDMMQRFQRFLPEFNTARNKLILLEPKLQTTLFESSVTRVQ
ncbi:hypothetical protein [Planctobacterium marinum]|uniref:hypothetical protein n=1 Tax=Planctobacterium marinum TaxID=1631968 RepID=UPI001E29D873|nr:hypothetical protein [Planctobacterium marinum]MCC2607469.1 hypothetical protein [Planctobacterium marinum]